MIEPGQDRKHLSILVVDDHPIIHRGLKQILADGFRSVEYGSAGNVGEAMRKLAERRWDIMILDISLPGRSGLEVLRDLKRLQPHLPVLVLSMHPEDQYAARMLKAGAAGYMTKETASDELVGAVRRILGGGKYLSKAMTEKLALLALSGFSERPHENLSDREFEVFKLYASGFRTSDVAGKLRLDQRTVSTYRSRILHKLNATSNADMVSYALQNRLL